MIIAIIITLIALVTVIIAIIAAVEIIWDTKKPGRNKLNRKGYIVIICGILMVILPLIQFLFQSRADEAKEATRKTEQREADSLQRVQYRNSISQMRKEYQTSVTKIQTAFGDSNYRTLAVIGKTLAGYKLALDTAKREITKLVRDSTNIKTVLPNQPILDVVAYANDPGLKFIKYEGGNNHYEINFKSQDGGSCCFDIKMSAVVLNKNMVGMIYKGPVRFHLTQSDNIATNEYQSWTFTIDDLIQYDWLYLWVRGTYKDRNGKNTYNIDRVYYNRKTVNTFGTMGIDVHKSVKEIVQQNEK